MLQLSEQEAKAYRDCPVILDLSSGFYIFPVSGLGLVAVDLSTKMNFKLA